MNEDRLKHIEGMVEQLIRIGGNTVAAIEELRNDVTELKNDVTGLKNDVAELKEDVQLLKKGQERTESSITGLREEMKSIFEILGEHDVAIRTMRRIPV